MPRIDAHQHFWIYDPVAQAWIDESMKVLRCDYLPIDLEKELDSHAFEGSVAVQAPQTLDETLWLLKLADEHAFIKGVVGWVDLCSSELESVLERLTLHPKLCGVRHILQHEPDEFLLRPDFQRGIASLERFGFTYDILVFQPQMEAAIELVRAFPRQRFVLDHLGKPKIRDRALEPWRKQLRRFSELPNTCCKLSGLVTETDTPNWKPSDLHPYLDVALECFGAERLLFGSDWPVCRLAAEYAEVVGVIDEYTANLSPSERSAIFGANAARFYRLD